MINPCLPHAERVRLGLTPSDQPSGPPQVDWDPGPLDCVRDRENDDMRPCALGKKCRACEGTLRVRFIMWRGRWRTRVDIARWLLAQREWKGAQLIAAGHSLYFRLDRSLMKLEHFTREELALFVPVEQIRASLT